MSEAVELSFGFERRLFRRALMAFWFSAVPRASFRWRVTFWTLAWLGILAIVMVGSALQISWAFIWGAVAAGFGIVILILQQSRMARFYSKLGEHWVKTGDMRGTFDATGMRIVQKGIEMRFDWAAVDAVVRVRGGTVFRVGMTMITVPDRALPGGMTGEAFRARLKEWRGAAL